MHVFPNLTYLFSDLSALHINLLVDNIMENLTSKLGETGNLLDYDVLTTFYGAISVHENNLDNRSGYLHFTRFLERRLKEIIPTVNSHNDLRRSAWQYYKCG